MSKSTSTCYGCTERHEGCHGHCERYMADREQRLKANKARLAIKQANSVLYDGYIRRKR